MYSEEKRLRARRIAMREFEFGGRVEGKNIRECFRQKDYDNICNYLKNPISNGLWMFKGTYLGNNEGVTQYIINELKSVNNITDVLNNIKDKIYDVDVKLLMEKGANTDIILKEIIKNKVTFITRVFSYMMYDTEEDQKRFLRTISNDRELIELINRENFKKNYSDALEYYKNYIFIYNYDLGVGDNYLSMLKNGVISYKGDEIDKENEMQKNIQIIALEPEPLEELIIFMQKIGKISNYKLYPIYSPEENVFNPYFTFLEYGYPYFIEKGKILDLVEQCVSIFKSDNFPYCITTIGIALEEQLTQIYETLFREKCPPGNTIGETYDLIENELKKKILPDEPEKLIDADELYGKINTLIKNKNGSSDYEEQLKIMRDIITLGKENNKIILSKIKSITKKDELPSIFPKYIKEGLTETIKYRNAISHKSRIPIGDFETIKSIYGLIILILWWVNEINNLDWKKDTNEILLQLLKRNTPKIIDLKI